MSRESMPRADATLTIAIEDATGATARALVVRCPHGVTTLPLPAMTDAAAERAATTLAILKHYGTTACACGRAAR